MKKISLIAVLCLAAVGLHAQKTVTGYVFNDKNNNQKKERKEQGIANVAVSNGVEVVLTDEKGRYELPVGDDNQIFVIKPAGYQLPVNKNNLPQFYYTHKPQGSPELKFAGVAPTGSLPKSVDFGLLETEENDTFKTLIFGDPQPRNREEVDFFARGVVKEVEGIQGISFGLSLGDLVGNDLDLFNPYIKAVKNVGIPWFNVMGNHDMNFDVKTDEMSDETYEAHFGPNNYAFNYGKVHFIVLDDILYPDPRDGKSYWGGFREDQFNFIENNLKYVPEDHLVVLAFHIPLFDRNHKDLFRDDDRQRLFDMLERFPYTLSLSAHTHIQRQHFFGKKDGWKQDKPHHHYNVGTTSGDWYSGKLNEQGVPAATMCDGTPKGYAYISFEGNNYEVKYKVAGKPDDYQMEVYMPKVLPQNEKTKAQIVVNFFMGAENDTVEYRIDGGKWKSLKHMKSFDPGYAYEVLGWDFAETLQDWRRPSNPIECTHLWSARLTTKLEEGEHKVEVKATDMYGNAHTKTSSYKIEKPSKLD